MADWRDSSFLDDDTFDQYSASLDRSPRRERYDSFVEGLGRYGQNKSRDDELVEKYKYVDLEHFAIDEFDYNKGMRDDSIYELDFNMEMDVNEDEYVNPKTPLISQLFSRRNRIQAIMLVGDVLKAKSKDYWDK
jgi:hypothetical protein